jgi:hypothetical protein
MIAITLTIISGTSLIIMHSIRRKFLSSIVDLKVLLQGKYRISKGKT